MSEAEDATSTLIGFGIFVALGVAGAVLSRTGSWGLGAVHRRGGRLVEPAEAARRAAARPPGRFAPPPGFPGLAFGGLRLDPDFATTGLALLGEPGSGKSLLTGAYSDSVLDLVARRCGARCLHFDPKLEDTGRILGRLPRDVRAHIVLPLDARSARWRIADDVTCFTEALQLANALVPEPKGGEAQPFFRMAAVPVLAGAVMGLVWAAPGRWDWRDVYHVCRTRRRLAWWLRRRPETRDAAAQYLTARSARDVVATLGTHLDRYTAVIGCMDRAAASFSLREFLATDGALVLGLADSVAEALKPLYALIVRWLTDLILARNDPTRPTFFVLDEFALFGKGDLLPLALKGRSGGASLLITAQDVLSLEAVHGEKEARALLGCMLGKGLLRVTSDATAKFASDCVGEQEVDQYTSSVADGANGRTVTRTQAVARRLLVMPDEFKGLPPPDWAGGRVSGVFTLPGVGAYRADVRFRDGAPPPPPGPPVPDFVPRPASDQVIRPFDRRDLARLGVPDNPLTREVFGVDPR